MELLIEQLAGNITRLTPAGRWDITGAEAIALKLSAVTGSGRHVIVDMAKVDYLSSMGIRSLVMSAKATSNKGSKLVLLSPVSTVAEVLNTAGINQLIPIYKNFDEALQGLTA